MIKDIEQLLKKYRRSAEECDRLFRQYSKEGNILAAEAMSSAKLTYGVIIHDLEKILKGNRPRDGTNRRAKAAVPKIYGNQRRMSPSED